MISTSCVTLLLAIGLKLPCLTVHLTMCCHWRETGDDWYNPDRVATLSDIYVNNHPVSKAARSGEGKPVKVSHVTASAEDGGVRPSSPKESHRPNYYNRGGGASPVRRCYTCHSRSG